MSQNPAGGEEVAPELSRIVNLDDLSGQRAVHEITADEGECQALARRFGINAVEALSARVCLRRMPRGDIEFSARIRASVIQECVVTLEPVRSEIDEDANLIFRPVGDAAIAETSVTIPADEDFEPFSGDSLDIGEAVAVELALSLDPFPRLPGADTTAIPEIGDEDLENGRDSPFRVLEGHPRKG